MRERLTATEAMPVDKGEEPRKCFYLTRHYPHEKMASHKIEISNGKTIYICSDCVPIVEGVRK